MSKTFVISGGNSGIGLEAARQLATQGHHVILLGRDEGKGSNAVESLQAVGGSAEFFACDLASHAGVKSVAKEIASAHPKIDGLIQGAGVLTFEEMRTVDGLHPVFAVNYLSRYHLAQRLLPSLRAAGSASIVFLVAGVGPKTRIDFGRFPRFDPFPGMRALPAIQIANYHYAAHLARTEAKVRAAVVNVGLVKTDILRSLSPTMKFAFNTLAPWFVIPLEKAASNATWLATRKEWKTGGYWPKPGLTSRVEPLTLDPAVTSQVVAISKQLTGA